MDYFYSLEDASGYTHSIDNLVLTYYVEGVGRHTVNRLVREIQGLREKYPDINYWEKLNIGACRRYSFFQNVVHLDDGIYLLVGHYKDYDKEKKEMYVFPLMRLEINPNKHAKKPVFLALMDIVNKNCYDGCINRYDYAVDIPLPPEDVQVFGTAKEKGLYKGTRYYGQRNRNGYCRIYDKGKEQGTGEILTRVEHVVSLVKGTKHLSFEKVFVKYQAAENNLHLSKTDSVIVRLCTLCRANGLDYEDILKGLDWRKLKTIREGLSESGYGYKRLVFDQAVHDRLLEYYKNYFSVKEPEPETAPDDIGTDEDGFMTLPEDAETLPFD